jgi:hypothetical protein
MEITMAKMRGYPHEITRPDDWCDYLQWQTDHVYIEDVNAICKFNNSYVIPLSKCSSLTGALTEAFNLAANLAEHEPDAYPSVVAKHFLELIRKQHKLPHFTSLMFEELWKAFEIKPRVEPERGPIA